MSRPEFPELPFGFPHAGGRSMPGVLSEARRLEAVEALARAAMNGSGGGGLPPGGATGELLAKASATDGDVEWVDPRPTQVAIGNFTPPSSTGVFTVSGLSFTPELVEFEVLHADGNNASTARGAMTASAQHCWAMNTDGSSNRRESDTSSCMRRISQFGALQIRAVRHSLSAGSFSVNFTTTVANGIILWKAIGR